MNRNENKNDLISVVIPVYNVEKYLDRCIISVVNQTYSNLEIIIIDDGASDNSPSICDKWERLDDRIRVIHQLNSGVSCARNMGLEMLHGDFTLFVDSDDYLEKDYIWQIYSAMDDSIDIVKSIPRTIYEDGIEKKEKEPKVYLQIIDVNDRSIEENMQWFRSVICNLYRTSIIKELRFETDLYVGEDSLFTFLAVKRSRKIAILNLKMYNYIEYSISAYHGPMNRKKFTEVEAWDRILDAMEEYPVTCHSIKRLMLGVYYNIYQELRLQGTYRQELKVIQAKFRKLWRFILTQDGVLERKVRIVTIMISCTGYDILVGLKNMLKSCSKKRNKN